MILSGPAMSKFVKPSQRILIEDALKHIHSCERSQREPSAQSVAGALQITLDEAASLLASLAARGLLVVKTGDFYLTSAGSEYALQIIRAHRLWERYLADAATDASALLLTNQILVHASPTWAPPQDWIRLQAADLRALYDALTDGTAVVILPSGWSTGEEP